MQYPISITKTKNGLRVKAPDVKGCSFIADDYLSATTLAPEKLFDAIQRIFDENGTIITPSSMDNYIDQKTNGNTVWAIVVVDINSLLGRAEKLNITLPKDLIKRIDLKVVANKALYKNRSHYLASLAKKDLLG